MTDAGEDNETADGHRGDANNKTDLVYGQQGDDEIWGSSLTETKSLLDGGSGDDKLYLGWKNKVGSESRIRGGSGKDIIRTDIWNRGTIDEVASQGDVHLFGDYEYGPEDLDKDLWGSADLIFNGKGDSSSNSAYIYGGDGGDTIHSGNEWNINQVYGQNGDDTIYLSQGSESVKVFGGSGHDTIVNVADYGSVESQDVPYNKQEVISGGAGNDLIRGTHGVDDYGKADMSAADGTQTIHGDDGEDKIYGGDGVDEDQKLAGGDGDDWIVGGDSASEQWLYGDQIDLSAAEFGAFDYYDELEARDGFYIMNASGDDVLYGGDLTGSQYLFGGYGNDKLFGGNFHTGSY